MGKRKRETNVPGNRGLDNLEDLTRGELKRLSAQVSALLAGTRGDEDAQELVWGVLQALLVERSVRTPPWAVVLRGAHGKSLAEGAEALVAFVDEYVRPQRKQERIRSVTLLLKVLLGWMDERGITVTVKSVAANIDKVPALTDRALPGYCKNGLLGLLIKARGRRITE